MSKIFPKSANALPLQIVIFLVVLGGVAAAGITYYATPAYLRIGYQPVQPVPFDHSLHAGQLGFDCRYCHASVEKSATSSVPAAATPPRTPKKITICSGRALADLGKIFDMGTDWDSRARQRPG